MADPNQISIYPQPDWTTTDFENVYSSLVTGGTNPDVAGNTVLGAMVGQGYNPQASTNALMNIAPFNPTQSIDTGFNSVGQNPNASANAQNASLPWYQQVWNVGYSLTGLAIPGVGAMQSLTPGVQCASADVLCRIQSEGSNAIALLLGVIFIIMGLVFLKAATNLDDHVYRAASNVKTQYSAAKRIAKIGSYAKDVAVVA